jgi:hypothetical protein
MIVRPAGLLLLLLLLLLAACAGDAAADRSGRCLYAVEMEYGQIMRWGSCASPPPNAIRRIDPDS